MWGDGKQTRSFCYIDDAVEGLIRVMKSDYKQPLNVGSDEMVSMNQMADMSMTIAGSHGCKGQMPIKHIPGPEGVRGRNSNNDLIKEVMSLPHNKARKLSRVLSLGVVGRRLLSPSVFAYSLPPLLFLSPSPFLPPSPCRTCRTCRI